MVKLLLNKIKSLTSIIFLIIFNSTLIAQNNCVNLINDSILTQKIKELELLFAKDSILESRYIGENSKESNKFKLFLEIYKGSSTEVLKCIVIKSEVDEIRAYAYLFLYASGVDAKLELSQKPLHLFYLIGDIGYCFLTVKDFTEFAKKNNKRFKTQIRG